MDSWTEGWISTFHEILTSRDLKASVSVPGPSVCLVSLDFSKKKQTS